MLRHASTHARQAILFDFLAPSVARTHPRFYSAAQLRTGPATASSSGSSTEKSSPARFPVHSFPADALLAKLNDDKHRILHMKAEKADQYNQILTAIRQTLNKPNRDTQKLLDLWTSLYKLRVIHMLGHSQIAPLSDLMIQTFLPGEKKGKEKERVAPSGVAQPEEATKPWPEESYEKMALQIAVIAAKFDSWDAMGAIMRYYIKAGDPDSILSLYDHFMAVVGDKDLLVDEELPVLGGLGRRGENERRGSEKDSDNLLATDSELMQHFPATAAGRVHLLMAAVTAYAMKDSFKGALDTCLKTTVTFSEPLAVGFTNHTFKHDPALKTKFRSYFKRLFVADIVSRPAAFVHYVTRLANQKSVDSLKRFYNVLSHELFDEGGFLAADPSLVTEAKPLSLTTVGWTAILSAFLKCGQKAQAAQMWEDMTKAGAPPGLSLWTALLDAYGDMGAADEAIAAWNMMIAQGLKPDALAYRGIVYALFKAKRPDQAINAFRDYKSQPVEDGPKRLSLYNTVLHGLVLCSRIDLALEIRKEMEKTGPKPDLVTFNTFINYYGRRQEFQGVAATMRAMQQFGFKGDVFTYNTILDALLKAGQTDAADVLLTLMSKQGVKKNTALCTSLLTHQLREGTEEGLRMAMTMLEKMEKDPDNPPNDITYTSVLSGIYRLRWLDPEELKRLEANILQRIRKRGVSLSTPAYNLLLKECLMDPRENGTQRALGFYEEMKRREIPIVNATWYILLIGLLDKGEWGLANKIVEDLYASGIHPTGPLLQKVNQIRNRASWNARTGF